MIVLGQSSGSAEPGEHVERIPRRAISARDALNEAPEYGSAFSRGLRVELPGATMLLISGTASVDENGATVHVGDFCAQTWRTYANITALLEAEGASWKDVVRTRCYLRDIERDYAQFNQIRTESTGNRVSIRCPRPRGSRRSCAGRIC